MMRTQAQPVETRFELASERIRRNSISVDSIGISFPLAATSILLLHVAIQDGSSLPWIEWTDLVVTFLASAVAWRLFRVLRKGEHSNWESQPSRDTGQLTTHSLPTAIEFVFLLTLVLVPFVVNAILRRTVPHGNPLEIQVTLAIRNLMIGLLVLPGQKAKRLAIFTSLFLSIYGALVTIAPTTNSLLAAYALFGLWWLMSDYWQRISAHFPDESTTEIPYFARVGALALVLFALAGGALAFQSTAVTSAVAGMLPSSGGTGASDPFARGGVGDGDQMVGATEDASSFGPIESELFLESKQPTLYDMFVDTYQEPTSAKNKKGRSRAIPLNSDVNQKKNHKEFAQNKKTSREFSAIRRQSRDRKRQQKLDDLKSKALLYVAGRTSLHLRLAYFNHWDGHTLSLEGELPEPSLRLEQDVDQRKWATWGSAASGECFGSSERHQLKIINLGSPTIPSPPNMTAAHIDKLHDAGFFRWEDGLLRLADRIPALTVLHVKSRRLKERLDSLLSLRESSVGIGASKGNDRQSHTKEPDEAETSQLYAHRLEAFATFPQLLRSERRLLSATAKSLTANATTDWQCVERICDHLRSFELDPDTVVPEDADDAVEHFLFESQRGPDYLFATSAAVLLRSLGYQTRVVSGLYANSNNYDRMARATVVYSNDVHFWAEIQTTEGHWITVEPTPGYHVLYARQSIFESAADVASIVVGQVFARPLVSLSCCFAIIGSLVCRQRFYAWAATRWWQMQLNSSPRQQVLHSIRLLQRLSTGRKSRRPAGQTLDNWITSLSDGFRDATSGSDNSQISEFRALVAWACYASSEGPMYPRASVRQICMDSVKLLKEHV